MLIIKGMRGERYEWRVVHRGGKTFRQRFRVGAPEHEHEAHKKASEKDIVNILEGMSIGSTRKIYGIDVTRVGKDAYTITLPKKETIEKEDSTQEKDKKPKKERKKSVSKKQKVEKETSGNLSAKAVAKVLMEIIRDKKRHLSYVKKEKEEVKLSTTQEYTKKGKEALARKDYVKALEHYKNAAASSAADSPVGKPVSTLAQKVAELKSLVSQQRKEEEKKESKKEIAEKLAEGIVGTQIEYKSGSRNIKAHVNDARVWADGDKVRVYMDFKHEELDKRYLPSGVYYDGEVHFNYPAFSNSGSKKDAVHDAMIDFEETIERHLTKLKTSDNQQREEEKKEAKKEPVPVDKLSNETISKYMAADDGLASIMKDFGLSKSEAFKYQTSVESENTKRIAEKRKEEAKKEEKEVASRVAKIYPSPESLSTKDVERLSRALVSSGIQKEFGGNTKDAFAFRSLLQKELKKREGMDVPTKEGEISFSKDKPAKFKGFPDSAAALLRDLKAGKLRGHRLGSRMFAKPYLGTHIIEKEGKVFASKDLLDMLEDISKKGKVEKKKDSYKEHISDNISKHNAENRDTKFHAKHWSVKGRERVYVKFAGKDFGFLERKGNAKWDDSGIKKMWLSDKESGIISKLSDNLNKHPDISGPKEEKKKLVIGEPKKEKMSDVERKAKEKEAREEKKLREKKEKVKETEQEKEFKALAKGTKVKVKGAPGMFNVVSYDKEKNRYSLINARGFPVTASPKNVIKKSLIFIKDGVDVEFLEFDEDVVQKIDKADLIKAFTPSVLKSWAEKMRKEGGEHPFQWCVNKASSFIGDPKGFCAVVHKEAYGMTPMQKKKKKSSG